MGVAAACQGGTPRLQEPLAIGSEGEECRPITKPPNAVLPAAVRGAVGANHAGEGGACHHHGQCALGGRGQGAAAGAGTPGGASSGDRSDRLLRCTPGGAGCFRCWQCQAGQPEALPEDQLCSRLEARPSGSFCQSARPRAWAGARLAASISPDRWPQASWANLSIRRATSRGSIGSAIATKWHSAKLRNQVPCRLANCRVWVLTSVMVVAKSHWPAK